MAEGLRALVLGFSDIAMRRVIPALGRVAGVSAVSVASRRGLSPEVLPSGRPGRLYGSYEEAIWTEARYGPSLVYISLPNSLHEEWAVAALEAGHHAVIDKPAVLDPQAAKRLAALAGRQKRCLAEATVWDVHPQIAAAQEILRECRCHPEGIVAAFSFPPLAPGNVRLSRALGGGSLNDLGPYAVSAGRVWFGSDPEEVSCRVGGRSEDGEVDTSFSLFCTYPGNRRLVGHFGFTTQYVNRMTLLGSSAVIDIPRAFTTPPHLRAELTTTITNRTEARSTHAGDTFQIFLQRVVTAIGAKTWEPYAERLLADARGMALLRRAALATEHHRVGD